MSIVQVGQHADDLTRASAFYAALLETPAAASYDPPGLVFFTLDGVRLLLDRALPSATVYLRVDSLDAAVARAVAAGGTEHTAAHHVFDHDDDTLGPAGHEEWHAFVTDSEGNTVGLVELRAFS